MEYTTLQTLISQAYTLGYLIYFFSLLGSFIGLFFILTSIIKMSTTTQPLHIHQLSFFKTIYFFFDLLTLPVILLLISLPLHNPDFKFFFLNLPSSGSLYNIINLSFGTEFITFTSKIFIDGLSINFVLLTIFISYFCYSLCANLDTEKKHFYKIIIFSIKNFLILCFISGDLVTFFFAFEATLLPMVALIYVFGSRQRKRRAANYLLLYTLFGSVCLLLSII